MKLVMKPKDAIAIDHILAAERELERAGVTFGAYTEPGCDGARVWLLDWSLRQAEVVMESVDGTARRPA